MRRDAVAAKAYVLLREAREVTLARGVVYLEKMRRLPSSTTAFSPDGVHIVTASWDATARVWDAKTGATLATLSGHKAWVHGAAFSPDGKRIVTASWDKTARVWDAATGAALATLPGHTYRRNPRRQFQSGRRAHRHGVLGQNGAGVGRGNWRCTGDARRTHRLGLEREVRP
jgi:hypothetical protein